MQRLSGRAPEPVAEEKKAVHGGNASAPEQAASTKSSGGALDANAARERYLQRKAAKAAAKTK